jgi:hypothetical protein
MIRQLSVSGTFSQKYVFPLAWIVVAGGFNLLLWFGDRVFAGFGPAPLGMKITSFLLLLAPLIFARGLYRLKRVRMADDGLLISDFRRQVFVPFAEIASVSPHDKIDPSQPIEVRFRTPTEFGDVITFVPLTRFGFPPRLDPAVDEFRAHVERARTLPMRGWRADCSSS